jgi:hypothetical protein
MTLYLKQSTSVNVAIGQLLSVTDGLTAYSTAVAVTDIHIWKANGTTVAHKSTGSSTHISDGIHYIALDSTDTNTVGAMIIFIQVSGGCLPMRQECCVLAANVYDSLIGGGGVDLLDVSVTQIAGAAVSTTTAQIGCNVVQVSGDSTAADNCEAFFDGTGYAGTNNTIPTVTTTTNVTTVNGLASGVITATSIATGAITNAKFAAGAIDAAAIAANAIDADSLASDAGTEIGTAVWATAARTLTAATNITSTGGTTVPQTGDSYARIGAAGASLTAIPWNASWDAEVQSECQDAITASSLPTAAQVADAVCDEVISTGHSTANSLAKIVYDNINAPIATVDTVVDGIATQVGTAGAGLTAIPWNASWDAEVQSECTDALNAYDPPTNTEMEARTLVAANYATATALSTVDGIVDDILVDTGTTLDALIKRVLGLTQENFRISSPSFTDGRMTGCTVKIYPTASDCTNDTNVLATYTITATYDGSGNLATYKSVLS